MSVLEDAIKVAAALCDQKKYGEAIDLIEEALAAAPPEDFAASTPTVRVCAPPRR